MKFSSSWRIKALGVNSYQLLPPFRPRMTHDDDDKAQHRLNCVHFFYQSNTQLHNNLDILFITKMWMTWHLGTSLNRVHSIYFKIVRILRKFCITLWLQLKGERNFKLSLEKWPRQDCHFLTIFDTIYDHISGHFSILVWSDPDFCTCPQLLLYAYHRANREIKYALHFVSSRERPWCHSVRRRINAAKRIICASIPGFLFERVRKHRSYARDNKRAILYHALTSRLFSRWDKV